MHPWQPAYDEFKNEVIPYLQAEGKRIGAKAKSGDSCCRQLIGAYAMLERSFDVGTFEVLKRHIDAYKASAAPPR